MILCGFLIGGIAHVLSLRERSSNQGEGTLVFPDRFVWIVWIHEPKQEKRAKLGRDVGVCDQSKVVTLLQCVGARICGAKFGCSQILKCSVFEMLSSG